MSKINELCELLKSLEAEQRELFAAQIGHIDWVGAEQRDAGSNFDSVMCEEMLNDIAAEAISITVQAGLVALFFQLMQGGWRFNEDHLTPALWATMEAVDTEKAAGLVKALVLAGANIDSKRTVNEDTLLMMAVRAKKGALILALLCAGAGTGVKNKNRQNVFKLIEDQEGLPMQRYFDSFKVAKRDFLSQLKAKMLMLGGRLQQLMTNRAAPGCVESIKRVLNDYQKLDHACKKDHVSLDTAQQQLDVLDKRAELIAETHGVELGGYPDTDSTEENDEAEDAKEERSVSGSSISDQRILATGAATGVTNLRRMKSGLLR
jgi:hypothetical protein